MGVAAFTSIKSLGKGETLFREGEPSTGFYVVQSGAINVHRVSALGKEQVISVFRAGDSFAEGTLATDAGYPADAVATEVSQLLHVGKPDFVALIHRDPALAIRMLASMSRHLRDLVGQIDDLQLKSVETRLANWLLRQCPSPDADGPYTFTLAISKRALASEIGTVSETLSRTFAKLRQQNLATVDGKAITVHCPAVLAAFLRRQLGA